MWLLDKIAEQRISEAMAKGELDDLPGLGHPLELDDDSLIPEELRSGYRLLKNAGYLPPVLELHREVASLEALILKARAEEERSGLIKRLNALLLRLNLDNTRSSVFSEARYLQRLREKNLHAAKSKK
ncbi:DnaJ family domain-containing protein [Kaarinaea lacus]